MEHDSSHLAAPSSSRTSGDAAPNAPSAYTPGEENPLAPRLNGRIRWLRERGRIKDAELMEEAVIALRMANDSAAIAKALGTPSA